MLRPAGLPEKEPFRETECPSCGSIVEVSEVFVLTPLLLVVPRTLVAHLIAKPEYVEAMKCSLLHILKNIYPRRHKDSRFTRWDRAHEITGAVFSGRRGVSPASERLAETDKR